MEVLAIIGFIAALIAVYIFLEYINKFTLRGYGYEFFSGAHMMQVIVGYWIIYFGNSVYVKALKDGVDLLNGQVLIAIGVVVVLVVIYKNFKAVPSALALLLTGLQLLIAVPLGVGAFIVLIMLIAAAAETKPVYVVNN
ncbi:hypothetical protein MNB_SM-4-1678 [hydrothermal vent metagenome]|uniref:Uncharacterized protein n=1 Tax=hydrothermal vent metagenome TaxID=652676 RepID=A0A1W1CEX0_9ZZZZ